jgi:hypothetical protein
MMGALIGELKTRLTWTKKSAVATSYSPSPTKSTFIIIDKSECRHSDKENIPVSSELHQALARRRSAMSESSRKFDVTLGPKEDRRPLAPVPSFLNTTINSHRVPVSTENAPRHDPVPTEDISAKTLAISGPQSPSSNDNLNPPGADFMVTELITTAFGTRRVRRLVIPPIAEGSLPSRDPRIIMELNCLRAQQKVGGAPKTG